MYELTMSNGYFNNGNQDTLVAFDVFYRKNPDNAGFAIFAGLEQVLEHLLHFQFRGDIYAMPEGTIVYPNEPIMTVELCGLYL